jgi:transcriptional regulator with XRE-family HTH domain
MKRPSVYVYDVKEPPGANVYRLRTARDWSMRTLAEKCVPPLEHTTIRRVEQNDGFTQDTLERVAKALGVQLYELFLPHELSGWSAMSKKARDRLVKMVQVAARSE